MSLVVGWEKQVFKDIIQSDFAQINGDGYLVLSPKVLHAGNYGIPQSRERIFFIGFKIKISDIQAAYKLSQNRNAEDYHRVIEQLEKSEDAATKAMANEMKNK